MTPAQLWRRLSDVVVHRILGVDDTPQRIAFGVLLGFVVAWTPTIGLQIVLYIAIASLLRANKVVGIPILFISNPFTAVPMYWFAWWLGSIVVHGGVPPEEPSEAAVRERVMDTGGGAPWYVALFTVEFWESLGAKIAELGVELWVGCLLLGFLTGIPAYFITLSAVKRFRRRRGTL
jgi:hypothetical protein